MTELQSLLLFTVAILAGAVAGGAGGDGADGGPLFRILQGDQVAYVNKRHVSCVALRSR